MIDGTVQKDGRRCRSSLADSRFWHLLLKLRHFWIEQFPALITSESRQLAECSLVCWIAICNVRAAQERTELLRLERGNLRIGPFTFAAANGISQSRALRMLRRH